MTDAEWPAPEPATPREPKRGTTPLPRVEDLPVAEQGYDREKVREAFDAFYRHAAQLDATLSTLEAVEVFQRTSAELRAELRNIRGSGWTVQSWQGGTGYAGGGRGRVSEWTLPPSFPRLAGEFVFLIVIGAVVGVVGWSSLTIVLVMGAALAVVLLLEWVAARERAIPRAAAPAAAPDLDREEPAGLPVGKTWVPPEEGPEALTMLDDAVVEGAVAESVPEPREDVEPEPEAVEVELAVVEPELLPPELELEPEPEPEPEAGESEPVAETVPDEPVRPEPSEEPGEPAPVPVESEEDIDPWEQGAQLPPLPEAEDLPYADELEAEQQFEAEEQLVEPSRHSWFRRPAPEEQIEPEEPHPHPQPEPVAVASKPEPEAEPEDQGPLPVDLLAEQATSALERSRARRRIPRRTRRR